jgi:two-component system nitrogen regulation sensor histidine kinase GlnL
MTPNKLHTNILDNLQIAVLLIDTQHLVTYINSAAETLLEVSGNRVIGEPLTSLFTETNSDKNDSTRLIDTINNISSFTKRENHLKLPSGQSITVDYAVTAIFDHEEIVSFVVELQPLDRLLRISRDEGLLAAQQNSQALIRGLAHEIKNPLGGLRGAAQLLAKELPDKSLEEYTNIIIEEADRLSNLVNRLLGSHSRLDLQPLNIHEVLERVKQLITAETGGEIIVKRQYDPSIPEVIGDKERLIQAMLNIARNAMQALLSSDREPGTAPTIIIKTRTMRQFTIGTQRHRLVCRISITDNGPGIPAELLETIFLPMISGRADGTGLGLSISQNIINHHQGLIECHSEPGNTSFSIYIPLKT